MKKTYLIGLSFLVLIVISCTKTKTVTTPAPVVIADSLLDGKKWQVEHLEWTQESVLYQYNRGASNNDHNFDYDFLIFNKDFTGSYINSVSTYNTTWSWTDATKTGLTFIIQGYDDGVSSPNSNFAVSWQNVSLTDSTLRYTEIYTHDNGEVVMSSGERTPAPVTP